MMNTHRGTNVVVLRLVLVTQTGVHILATRLILKDSYLWSTIIVLQWFLSCKKYL